MIIRKYAGVLLMVCLIANSALATNTWTASSGSWGSPAGAASTNWSGGIVPAATEQVKIKGDMTCTVDVTTCVMGTQKLTVGTTATEAVLNVVSGGTLNAGAEVQIGDNGGILGRITQTGGTVNLVNGTASAKLEVGYKTGVGNYTISGGSIVGDATYSQLQVGASGAIGGTGTFTVAGTGGSISIAKLYVGASTAYSQYTGNGTLAFEIDGGVSDINAGDVYIDPNGLVGAVANLSVTKTGALPTGDIILINNTGSNDVTGAFDNVAWDSTITLGDVNYTLTKTYIGGLDGLANDVALIRRTFALTYTAGANGSIIGTTPQTVEYGIDGTAVTAQPDPGYHFVNWSDDSTENPRTDVNVTADITVTASFAIDTFTLTYTAGANGSIIGTTPQTVDYGTNGAEVTAQPDPCCHFVIWSDDSTQNPRTDVNVTADITVTASFEIGLTLTYTAGAHGSIIGTTPQAVDYNTDGTAVTAQSDPGYHFVKWSDDSTENPRTDVNATTNITVQASFAIDNTVIAGKCKVAAGKTQYHGDSDYNDMKDSFTASGTMTVVPDDPNTIDHIDVNIVSADGNSIYFESNDFNYSRNVKKNVFTHKYKIGKYNPTQGAITSLVIDFSKKTFAVTVSSADLTGLACPVQLMISLGDLVLAGDVNEAIVNGKNKTIPTRLMRLYGDKLVVTRARAKNSIKVSSDTLSVKGDIAVADMNLDTNEPNLCNRDVILAWGDGDVNTQTFVIPAGSFTASRKGHTYKCRNIEADANDANVGFVTATLDLDKCTFTAAVKGASGLFADAAGAAVFSVTFDTEQGTFDEEDGYALP